MPVSAQFPNNQGNAGFKIRKHAYFAALLTLFLVFFYIYYLPVDEAHGRGHDYLQSIYSLYFTRSEVGNFFFNFEVNVPQIINGLPFNALALSDFGIGQNLYLIMPPFEAFVANEFLRRMLALVGMYLLIKDYLLPRTDRGLFIAAFVAFSFAVLPDQSNRFATITMQPLLYWAFLNIWFEDYRKRNFTILFFYPLYSMLVLGGFVICGYFLVATIFAFWTDRPNKKLILYLFAAICAFYIFIEMRMFYHWFLADYVSMRHLREAAPPDFDRFFVHLRGTFFKADHANHVTEHSPGILFIVVLGFISMAASKLGWGKSSRGNPIQEDIAATQRLFTLLFGLVVLNSIIYALDQSHFMDFKYQIGFPFSFHRLDVSSPVIWRLLLALSVYILAVRFGPRWRWMASTLLILIAVHSLLQLPGVKGDIRNRLGIPEHVGLRAYIMGHAVKPNPRYHLDQTALKTYFQTDTFPEIESVIRARTGLEQADYRTVSIDLVPSLARYHGYYTLDAWLYDGPASYPKQFFRISAPEFAKDNMTGPRKKGLVGLEVYVSNKSRKAKGIDIDLDACAFRDLGGKVIFSRHPIIEPGRLGFDFLGRFGAVHAYLLQERWNCPVQ
jgi:hypothetical protein